MDLYTKCKKLNYTGGPGSQTQIRLGRSELCKKTRNWNGPKRLHKVHVLNLYPVQRQLCAMNHCKGPEQRAWVLVWESVGGGAQRGGLLGLRVAYGGLICCLCDCLVHPQPQIFHQKQNFDIMYIFSFTTQPPACLDKNLLLV